MGTGSDLTPPPQPPGVRVRRLAEGSFAVAGEIDLAAEAVLRAELVPAAVPGAHIHVDMSAVTFVDSTGLNLLVEMVNAIGPEGRLTVSRPTAFVRRVLRVSGVERHPAVTVD